MNIQLGNPYRLKVQINNDYGEPITAGSFSVVLKRNSDEYYWDETGEGFWEFELVSGLALSHDRQGSWYNNISENAFLTEGQYTAFFDSTAPNITDSFDLNVIRMATQWSATAG